MSQRRAFRPGHSSSFGHNVHVASTPGGTPQSTSKISDTRKGPPPFINFEEHLNATNGDFTIPALNLSLNSSASTVFSCPAPEIPVRFTQDQSAAESILGRQPPSTIPSPTPTLVGEPGAPTRLSGIPDISRDPRFAPDNARILQFPIDTRPHKQPPSPRKSNQGSNMHEMFARMNSTAQSSSADPQYQPMAPPVPTSRPSKATRTLSESEFESRPTKRLKTNQIVQTKNVPQVLQVQGDQEVMHTSGANGSADWTLRIAHPYPLRGALYPMNIHQLGGQVSYPSSPRRQGDLTFEEDRCSAGPSSAEGEYLYPSNTMIDYTEVPDQDSPIRGVEAGGGLGFGGKLDLYRRKKSEEYERASQRWANCSLDVWLAGSDEILGEFMALFDRVTEHMAGNLEMFSRLGRTLNEHHSQVLDKRESMLVEAKAVLLTGGGHLAAVKLRGV